MASIGPALGFGLQPPSGWELARGGALLLSSAVLWIGPILSTPRATVVR